MNEEPPNHRPRWAIWLPLVSFAIFLGVAAAGLFNPADRVITSKLIGQPLPEFALEPVLQTQAGLSTGDFSDGQPKLLNIFASWCLPCIAEAPHLETLARSGVVIHGVAIRDRPDDVAAFLARNGNPYTRIGADNVSAVQLSLGSSGVPETFVIDGKGTIVYQHIGDIRAETIPILIDKLEGAR